MLNRNSDFKFRPQIIGLLLFFVIVIAGCGSTTLVLTDAEAVFNEELYKETGKYVCTLNGVVKDSEGQPRKGLKVNVAEGEYLNIKSTETVTAVDGSYSIDLYWEESPYLYADVFPGPAQSSLTDIAFAYLKDARTLNLEIPIIVDDSEEPLVINPITLYSMNFILGKIAKDAIDNRIYKLKFIAEDIDSKLRINGATFTLRPVGSITPPDTLLQNYINSKILRDISLESVTHYVYEEEVKTLLPQSQVEFLVLSFGNYTITFEHPEYHTIVENIYADRSWKKNILVSRKSSSLRYDMIDQ